MNPRKSRNDSRRPSKLLVLDSSYSLEAIRARGLEESVTCRDLDGYFTHVWTVHPFATLVTSESWTPRYGTPQMHELNATHTFIEGKVGRYAWLHRAPSLNFLLSQVGIFVLLARLIRKEQVSAIRAGSPLYLGLLAWSLSRYCRIPFVVRVGGNHDKIYEATGQPQEKRLFRYRAIEKVVERFVFRRADLVAGANQDNLGFAIANGARPDRCTLFRYGNLIDKRHFIAPGERSSGAKRLSEFGVSPYRFILYIGRLEAVKRPDDVVRVLAAIRAGGVDMKAILVGEGQLRTTIEQLSVELGLQKHVLLCGNRDQTWLAEVIPLAAAVVSPHTGRALAEAALGAVPVAAYDVDWQAELIETGVTGELVPFGDWQALANSVLRLVQDAPHARRMGERLRQRAIDMMDPQRLDEHERQQYDKLLGVRTTTAQPDSDEPVAPSANLHD